jgi:predicted flavoprotein YhiN
MEIKKFPRIFAAGEMIDWDAPTGGFLIQAAVSTGYCAAKGALSILDPT